MPRRISTILAVGLFFIVASVVQSLIFVPTTMNHIPKCFSYELMDFGRNMRLERFGDFIVQRYCGASLGEKSLPENIWSQAHFSYLRNGIARESSTWKTSVQIQPGFTWPVQFGKSRFNLALHDMGQVGVFPEQQNNWQWLSGIVGKQQKPLKILNCFAYTGGSTMACARNAAIQVTHLDASKPSVNIAKTNMQSSGLISPVRWIIDDVITFIQREIKRGNKYDGIILDPPAFGKFGSKEWVLNRDFVNVMHMLPQLLVDKPLFVLLTCHDLQWQSHRLAALLQDTMPTIASNAIDHGTMMIKTTTAQKSLHLGTFARWGSQ